MGWNTTVVVLNDALEYIENDPEFGRKLGAAVRRLTVARPVKIDAHDRERGGISSAAVAVETHDNDTVVTVEVGGNTAEVVATRYDPKFPGLEVRDTHQCFACGAVHAGIECKYCDTCGKALQERKTYYEALQRIRLCLEDEKLGGPERALEVLYDALIAGPLGERLDVLDWRAVVAGTLKKEDAQAAAKKIPWPHGRDKGE